MYTAADCPVRGAVDFRETIPIQMEEYDMKLRELLNGVPVASCAVNLEMEICRRQL